MKSKKPVSLIIMTAVYIAASVMLAIAVQKGQNIDYLTIVLLVVCLLFLIFRWYLYFKGKKN